jgi:myo-inositol-1(or 4)-monophosphatase
VGAERPLRDDRERDGGQRPPSAGDLRALRDLAADVARRAGQLQAAALHGSLQVETKSSPSDLVSQVDREAERLIVDLLIERRPADGVLAEEGALKAGTSGVRWIVDPLDGTTNYVYGDPSFAVSIAAEVDGAVRAGVVYETVAGRTYSAIEGEGAWLDGRPLRRRAPQDLSRALIATGFSYEAAERGWEGEALARLLPAVRDIRRSGSAALDLCHLAEGRLDGYYELGLKPWDYAAGTLIALEVGAEVRVLPARDGRRAVVAAWPPLTGSLLELLRQVGVVTDTVPST